MDTQHVARRRLHSLERCAFCGSRTGLYRTFLYTTHSMAAVCEDPVKCLRRKQKARNG